MRRNLNLAQFTGRHHARQTWRSLDHDGRTDCLEGRAINDDFIECEGLWRQDLVRCGLHVSWWNSACVTSRKRFSIPMLRTNELSLVPYMPIKIAMVCQGNRVRTSGYLSSPTQMQATQGASIAVLSSWIVTDLPPLRRSQGRACRSNATDISMREGGVPRRGSRLSQQKSLDASKNAQTSGWHFRRGRDCGAQASKETCGLCERSSWLSRRRHHVR